MLIEFRCENHRSIRDEQALSMEAVLTEEIHAEVPRTVKGYKEKLLPAVALYGANASGKTNMLDAFQFMRDAVLYSHRVWSPDRGIPVDPFAVNKGSRIGSEYFVKILLNEVEFEYGFFMNGETILEEWMNASPNGKKQTWFERTGDKFKFGKSLSGENKAIVKLTRPNSLFVSAAVQNGHSQLGRIYNLFRDICMLGLNPLRYVLHGPLDPSFINEYLLESATSGYMVNKPDDFMQNAIVELLKIADVGITGIRFFETTGHGLTPESKAWRIEFLHKTSTSEFWLDFLHESRGTITVYRMGMKMLTILQSGGIMLVDELESSLHPAVAARIIRLFNDPATNPNNAQLIFTTHDTQLIGNMFGEPILRRDQVWFTEKDQEGATKLYPLTDYKPRKNENLERGYLQGRYGAIPFLGDFKFLSGDRS